MNLEGMKNQSFPAYSFEDWEKKAEESLKGKPIESLQKTTYEEIILKPLYCQEDLEKVPDLPGVTDFRRGLYPFGNKTNKWKIAQKIKATSAESLAEQLRAAFKRGQTAISFEVSKKILENPEVLADGLREFCHRYPFAVDAKGNQDSILKALEKQIKDAENISGYIASDPLAAFSVSGCLPEKTSEYFQKWAQRASETSTIFPHLKTVLVNTAPYHNGGANAVQELGIAAAAGAFYLQTLLENEMELEKALSSIVFHFSMGSSFFTEIAKLRAARIIWSKIAEAYNAKPTDQGMEISAETSTYTKTFHDSHVNLLRAGNEAFAAVLGGIQYLHVSPFDELTGAGNFSERIARNTQLILQEEMHLQNVIDPAGGSWYIESLTNELAKKAWEFFQQIEARGGIVECLQANWLQAEIARVHEKRTADIFTRKASIIGTNKYANLAEKVKVQQKEPRLQIDPDKNTVTFQPIPQTRLAVPFETLRKRAAALKQKPTVGMLCLGSLRQHKPRLDFVKGFLAAGGIDGVASEPVFTEAEAKQFVAAAETKHICLCGNDELYETIGFELMQTLKQLFPEHTFYLAGRPDNEKQLQWKQTGISEFIHIKSNCYETLFAMLTEMEVALNEHSEA